MHSDNAIEQLLDEAGITKVQGEEFILSAQRTMCCLGIPLDSDISKCLVYYYFDNHIAKLNENNDDTKEWLENASPVIAPGTPMPMDFDPMEETGIGKATFFVHDCWELPKRYIPLTGMVELEGGYLYDLETDAVYDFDLSDHKQLVEGTLAPRWKTFYDFIVWYIS